MTVSCSDARIAVALYARAWVELYHKRKINAVRGVALYARAWVEIPLIG